MNKIVNNQTNNNLDLYHNPSSLFYCKMHAAILMEFSKMLKVCLDGLKL